MLRISMFNQENLYNFIREFADAEMTEGFTLIQELTYVDSNISRAELIFCRDYYSRAYQKLCYNYTEEELKGEARAAILRAAKKLLFLNAKANKEGLGFIKERIDLNDLNMVYNVLKAYVYIINSWNI